MPSTLPKVQGNVPQVLYDQLVALQETQGCSRSKALTIVLEGYFQMDTAPPVDDRLSVMQEVVADLNDRLSALEALPKRVDALEIRERELLTKGIKQLHDRVEELSQAKEQQLKPLDMVTAIMAPMQARIDQLEERLLREQANKIEVSV